MDPDFGAALAACLLRIPRGRVATCGVVAVALGDVRSARAVAEWLGRHAEVPGAHRVVRADGSSVVKRGSGSLHREGIRLTNGRVPPDAFVDRLPPVPLLRSLRAEQERLATTVREEDGPDRPARVAGVDVSYEGDVAYAVAVSLRLDDLIPVEVVQVKMRTDFPYVPTYLAYRELPGIQAAVSRLSTRPDVLLIDGHGRLHPARFGIACHAGVLVDLPTIGVAKHALVGRPVRGRIGRSATRIEMGGRTEGYAWTPPGRERPIFVSVGHRISLERALAVVERTTNRGYPEPLRLADRISKERKQKEKREKGAMR